MTMSSNEIPHLINTSIINATHDALWQPEALSQRGLTPKQVLVITTSTSENNDENQLLLKILDACKLTTEEYNHITLAKDETIAWHQLKEQLQVRSVILFAIEPQALGLSVHFMPHQTNRFSDCNWIYTTSLSEINQRQEIKAHLWNYGLKPVFIDKIYG